jgi:hypothetical protein
MTTRQKLLLLDQAYPYHSAIRRGKRYVDTHFLRRHRYSPALRAVHSCWPHYPDLRPSTHCSPLVASAQRLEDSDLRSFRAIVRVSVRNFAKSYSYKFSSPSCPKLFREMCNIALLRCELRHTVNPVTTEVPNDHDFSRQELDFHCRTGQPGNGSGKARYSGQATLPRVG